MAVSARGAAIAALRAALATALAARSPPLVIRNETIPQRLPAGGLVVVQDRKTVEETAILSPPRWQIRHVAELVAAAPGAASARAVSVPVLLWFTAGETSLS